MVVVTPILVTSAGSRPCALLTRFCTFTAAISGLVPCLNTTSIVPRPAFEAVELIYIMFSTPLILSSSGMITAFIMALASAPVYWAVTCTVGGAMSGYCSTGRVRSEIIPTISIKIDTDMAITDRLINILPFILFLRNRNYYFTCVPSRIRPAPSATISSPAFKPLSTTYSRPSSVGAILTMFDTALPSTTL